MAERPDHNRPQAASLGEALSHFQIEVPETAVPQLDAYRRLLWEWNERLNLTRHTTFEKFATRDIVDTLALSRLLEPGERVLDMGTGGGVPGIPLAILRPDLKISLSESVGKKARAAESMVKQLQLDVPVFHARAEEVLGAQATNAVVARAVAPLDKMLRWLADSWESFERLLVIKGKSWIEERGRARHLGLLKSLQLRKADAYRAPGSDAESVILCLQRPGDGNGDDDLDL